MIKTKASKVNHAKRQQEELGYEWKSPSKLPEMYSLKQIGEWKKKIIDILDSGAATTLTGACELLDISPTRAAIWRRRDETWRELLGEAEQRLADKLEQELLEPEIGGKPINMAYVTARIFLLKGIRPNKYRDNFKINVDDSKTKEILEELRSLSKADQTKLANIKEGSFSDAENEITEG